MSRKKFYDEGASLKDKKTFERFLSEDEELVLATGYGSYFLRQSFVHFMILPGGIGILAGIGISFWYQFNLGYGILLGLLFSAIIAWLKTMHLYNAHRYLLTTRRIILKQGVFSVQLTTALYDKITHIEVAQSLYDRLVMHQGTVLVNTAGGGNDVLKIDKIDAPIEFKNLLERLINREREQFGKGTGPVVTLEGELVED